MLSFSHNKGPQCECHQGPNSTFQLSNTNHNLVFPFIPLPVNLNTHLHEGKYLLKLRSTLIAAYFQSDIITLQCKAALYQFYILCFLSNSRRHCDFTHQHHQVTFSLFRRYFGGKLLLSCVQLPLFYTNHHNQRNKSVTKYARIVILHQRLIQYSHVNLLLSTSALRGVSTGHTKQGYLNPTLPILCSIQI